MALGHIRHEQWRQLGLDLRQARLVFTPGVFFLRKLRQTMTPYGLEPNLFYRALARRKSLCAFLMRTRQAGPMRLRKRLIGGCAMGFGSLSEPCEGSLRWLTVQMPTHLRRACE
jgi:hypothetical protein